MVNTAKWAHPIFDSVFPSTVGFDKMFDIFDNAADIVSNVNGNFPPFSLVKLDESNYQIELAVAGYTEKDVEVTAEKNWLTVVGKKAGDDPRKYLVKGIAGRNFTRKFVLADTIVVRDVTLTNGILAIKLENVIPEEQKPRKIPVNGGATLDAQLLTESK